jgi:hypothetical protein
MAGAMVGRARRTLRGEFRRLAPAAHGARLLIEAALAAPGPAACSNIPRHCEAR